MRPQSSKAFGKVPHGMNSGVPGTFKHSHMNDVSSKNSRIEDFVKAPERLPEKIPGLTNYIRD